MSTDTITKADVERWIDAWNSHDIDRIAELFAAGAEIHQPQNPQPLDVDGVRRFFTMLFGAYPDIRFELEGTTIEGLEAASWERVTGSFTGPFTDPANGAVVEPTHRSFDLRAAMRLTYHADHSLRAVHIYWDRMEFARQLGLLPAAEAPTS